MKKIIFTALAVMSVLLMGCAQAINGDDPAATSGGIVYEDKNGETITISENNATISNIKNASLVIESGVTKLSIGNVKDLTIKNANLDKLTVESSAELSFVNSQIAELEANGNLVIKEGTTGSSGRSARVADPAVQAEKASVVINKLVMKGNVEAGFGLYKKIERAATASDKEFVLAENSTATVKDYEDKTKGDNAQFTLTPAYENDANFYGVKLNQANGPSKASPLYLSVFLKKGDAESQIFWGNTEQYGSSDHVKSIVNSDYFYWPFLEAGKEYQITMCYYTPKAGTNGVLTACKTVTVTPTKGKGDILVFLDENKGTVDFKENGDIVWTKTPVLGATADAAITYELFGAKADGTGKWLTCNGFSDLNPKKFDTYNIYKDGFLPALGGDWNTDVVDNKVFLLFNYNLESADTVNGEAYKYAVHTSVLKEETSKVVYDVNKYEKAFDFELDKTNRKIKITKLTENYKSTWEDKGGNTLMWHFYKENVEESKFFNVEITNLVKDSEIAIPDTNIPDDWLTATVKVGCHLFFINAENENNPAWKAFLTEKTFTVAGE